MLSAALALTAAIVTGTPGAEPLAELSTATLRRALSLPVDDAGTGTSLSLDASPRRRATAGGPVCSGDVCQPAVSVPGYDPGYGRAHRSEMFVALLTRAHVEPIATLAWALVATGVRFDYTPVAFDGPNSGGHGWGSVFLRLRLRIDARGAVVVPPRPR